MEKNKNKKENEVEVEEGGKRRTRVEGGGKGRWTKRALMCEDLGRGGFTHGRDMSHRTEISPTSTSTSTSTSRRSYGPNHEEGYRRESLSPTTPEPSSLLLLLLFKKKTFSVLPAAPFRPFNVVEVIRIGLSLYLRANSLKTSLPLSLSLSPPPPPPLLPNFHQLRG